MADRRVFLGTVLIAASNVFKLGLQFAVLPVLAHLLTPAAYGLVALATPFIFLANIFADGGLGSTIVRGDETTPELESTVFWTSGAISAGLALLICALSLPFAWIVRQPAVTPILLALTPVLLLSGLASAPNAKILRDQRFQIFAMGDICSATSGAAVAFWCAAHGWGAWSLVSQQLTLWVVRFLWLFIASRVRIRFVLKPELLKGAWSFGANSVGIGLLDFVSRNVDNLLVGAILGVSALGSYTVAYQLMRMPELIIAGPVFMTLFPVLARMKNDPEKLTRTALSYLSLVATVAFPIYAGLACVADLAVGTVLGEKWRASAPVLVLLGPGGACFTIYAIGSAVMFGAGGIVQQLQIAIYIALTTAVGVVGGAWFGIPGVAYGVSVAMLIAAPPYGILLSRKLDCSLFDLAKCFIPPLGATLLMVLGVLLLRALVHTLAPWFLLPTLIAAGAVVYAGARVVFGGRNLFDQVRWVLSTRSQAA